jgi:Putative dehydrogenase domain of multifunctional non-ribosomal peptide synthetases and related enzymes
MHPPAGKTNSVLSPREIYRGRNVFVLGGTGFLGKVLTSMLLHRFPDIGRVYVMVRRGTGTSSEKRFWDNVVPSPTFDPLREKFGGADGLREFLSRKVRVVDGDITEDNLGLSEEQAAQVAADISVVINTSGKVTFNPPLESALRTNVQGTKNVIAFVKRMQRPALDSHQHLLRGRQPQWQRVGERAARRLLPAPRGVGGNALLGRARDRRLRPHRGRGARPG